MKKFLLFALFTGFSLSAQEAASDMKYRRSSLSMVLIESENFPNKDAVMSSWGNYPFPDKYNKHNIDLKSVNFDAIKLTEAEMLAGGFLKDTLKTTLQLLKAAVKPVRYLNNEQTLAVVLPSEDEEYQLKINKIISERKLANGLVSTWFNLSPDGKLTLI